MDGEKTGLLLAGLFFMQDHRSEQLCVFDLADFYALPDVIPKGFISPPKIKPEIFCLLGECINNESSEPLMVGKIFTVTLN